MSKLIEVPCAVGDTVWGIKEDQYKTHYFSYSVIVEYIKITEHGIAFGRDGSGMFPDIIFNAHDIGKTVFLAKEEAELAVDKLNVLKGNVNSNRSASYILAEHSLLESILEEREGTCMW